MGEAAGQSLQLCSSFAHVHTALLQHSSSGVHLLICTYVCKSKEEGGNEREIEREEGKESEGKYPRCRLA